MEKAEIKRIGDFLSDVRERICERDEPVTSNEYRSAEKESLSQT
jgi:hypothetical protein